MFEGQKTEAETPPDDVTETAEITGDRAQYLAQVDSSQSDEQKYSQSDFDTLKELFEQHEGEIAPEEVDELLQGATLTDYQKEALVTATRGNQGVADWDLAEQEILDHGVGIEPNQNPSLTAWKDVALSRNFGGDQEKLFRRVDLIEAIDEVGVVDVSEGFSPEIREIQEMLAELKDPEGQPYYQHEIDSIGGELTEEALERAKQDLGITSSIEGLFGATTGEAIESKIIEQSVAPEPEPEADSAPSGVEVSPEEVVKVEQVITQTQKPGSPTLSTEELTIEKTADGSSAVVYNDAGQEIYSVEKIGNEDSFKVSFTEEGKAAFDRTRIGQVGGADNSSVHNDVIIPASLLGGGAENHAIRIEDPEVIASGDAEIHVITSTEEGRPDLLQVVSINQDGEQKNQYQTSFGTDASEHAETLGLDALANDPDLEKEIERISRLATPEERVAAFDKVWTDQMKGLPAELVASIKENPGEFAKSLAKDFAVEAGIGAIPFAGQAYEVGQTAVEASKALYHMKMIMDVRSELGSETSTSSELVEDMTKGIGAARISGNAVVGWLGSEIAVNTGRGLVKGSGILKKHFDVNSKVDASGNNSNPVDVEARKQSNLDLIEVSGKPEHWELDSQGELVLNKEKLSYKAKDAYEALEAKFGPEQVKELVRDYVDEGFEGLEKHALSADLTSHDLYRLAGSLHNFDNIGQHDIQHIVGSVGNLADRTQGYGTTASDEVLGLVISEGVGLGKHDALEFNSDGSLSAESIEHINAKADSMYLNRVALAEEKFGYVEGIIKPDRIQLIDTPEGAIADFTEAAENANAFTHMTPEQRAHFDALLKQEAESGELVAKIEEKGNSFAASDSKALSYIRTTIGEVAEDMDRDTFRQRYVNEIALDAVLSHEEALPEFRNPLGDYEKVKDVEDLLPKMQRYKDQINAGQ